MVSAINSGPDAAKLLHSSQMTPEKELHDAFGITYEQLQKVIAEAAQGTAGKQGFCDVFLQAGSAHAITLDQEVIKNASSAHVNGAGVRVVVGDKTGYSHTDHVNTTNLKRCATIARAICEHARENHNLELKESREESAHRSCGYSESGADIFKPHNLYGNEESPTNWDLKEKIALLKKMDRMARDFDPRISNVSVSLAVEDYVIIIATSRGAIFADRRPLVRLNIACQAEENGKRENGSSGGGGRFDFRTLLEEDYWSDHVLIAARQAIELLSAEPAPAGEMDVVLGSGWPGVLIHEAVGHGLEGDFNRKGTSAFSNLMGSSVASKLVTVIDDGTIAERRGSLNMDDEGTPTGRTVLIENGKLTGYMQDKQNASLMKASLTGNGRRQDYRFAPIPRMTNTYMAEGTSSPDEIIASVKKGIFATTFGGGQVDITNGDFTFSATGAYLIENGKITKPIKGATLIGNGPKALHKVVMVGNDVALDRGIGTCGKDGQGVPVGVGMPTIRINGITVGGSKN